jgi:hypothetical protein
MEELRKKLARLVASAKSRKSRGLRDAAAPHLKRLKKESEQAAMSKKEAATGKPCAICLELLKKKHALLECGHEFCVKCIKHWTSQSMLCPLCKKASFRILECKDGKMISEHKISIKKLN